MTITVSVPIDLERRSLPERLRFWAHAYQRVPVPNLRVIAMMEEAAIEVELGERTKLTFRGPG